MALLFITGLIAPNIVLANRSATFVFRGQDIKKLPAQSRPARIALRQPAPVLTEGAIIYTTQHFRILWGENYDKSDPDWNDPDNDFIPTWIEELADALENAYAIQVNLGFSTPYGVSEYYLDVYVANTGVRVENVDITLSSDYYAFTDIDVDYQVAYFVFNNDFSPHTDREISVLRATAAHELFHAIQRVDFPWDDENLVPDEIFSKEVWWLESTATWIEEICEPESNDYIQYIKMLLENPSTSLTDSNGKHEYGAALFAGFLWLKKGGPGLWQDVFISLFEKGGTTAVDEALLSNGFGSFKEAVAEFWSLAAHPEDTWPDGLLYYTDSGATVFQDIAILPFFSQIPMPEVFGARLLHFPGSITELEVKLLNMDQSSRVLVSASLKGEDFAVSFPVNDEPFSIHGSPGKDLYLAVVNISDPDSGYSNNFEIQIINKTLNSTLPGDIDGNEVINFKDFDLGFQILNGKIPGAQVMSTSDADKNGTIDIIENIYILQYILKAENK